MEHGKVATGRAFRPDEWVGGLIERTGIACCQDLQALRGANQKGKRDKRREHFWGCVGRGIPKIRNFS